MIMKERQKWIVLVVLLLTLDVVAISLSSSGAQMTSNEFGPFTVSDVLGKAMLGDYVYVKGMVAEVMEDHVSEKGYVYQELMLGDGEEEIKLFCSTKYGRVNVSKGNEITFNGELRKYFGELEIYGFCSETKVL